MFDASFMRQKNALTFSSAGSLNIKGPNKNPDLMPFMRLSFFAISGNNFAETKISQKQKGEKKVKAKKLELNQETLKNLAQKQHGPNAACTLNSDLSLVNTGCVHTQCAC
jgi:hypothetical protein